MLARTHTAGLDGINGFVIGIESAIGPGLPRLTVIGRVGGPIDTAGSRVRTALAHCGHELPPAKQIINVSPAEPREDGPGIDLAMACALLTSHGVIPSTSLDGVLLWAELGPTGRLLPAPGTWVVAEVAKRHGFRRLVLAPESTNDAARIHGLELLPVSDLTKLVAHLRGELALDLADRSARLELERAPVLADMADVHGLELPRRAVEVMVAGGHHLLLHGPSGSGKTMLARRVAGLLPALDDAQAFEIAKIHDAHQTGFRWSRRPPVRVPSASSSACLLGEFSLAHGGVLVLDELPEFADACLASLSRTLDDGFVTHWPARFLLLATMRRYQARIPKRVLDCMDLVVPVDPPLTTWARESDESSSVIRARIIVARERQRQRLHATPWTRNAEIPTSGRAIERLCPAVPETQRRLADLAGRGTPSTRDLNRIRRVARTIADLDLDRDPSLPLEFELLLQAARLRRPKDQRP